MAKRYRDRMIEEMEVRGLDIKTQKAYLKGMEMLIEYHNKPPAEVDLEGIKKFQRYLLKERKLSANTINRHLTAIRFFYRYILERYWYADALPRLKAPKRMPQVLNEQEVVLLINSTHKVMYKAIIMTLCVQCASFGSATTHKVKPYLCAWKSIAMEKPAGGYNWQCVQQRMHSQ